MANKFFTSQELNWNDTHYEVIETIGDTLRLRDVTTDTAVVATTDELLQAFIDKSLRFPLPPQTDSVLEWDDYTDREREVAEERFDAIEPLLNSVNGELTAAINSRADFLRRSGKKGGKSALWEWLRLYRDSGCDIRALVPDYSKRGGKGDKRLHPESEKIMMAVIRRMRDIRQPKSLRSIYAVVVDDLNKVNAGQVEQLPVPSQSTVARRIDVIDCERRMLRRRKATRSQDPLAQYGTRITPDIPMSQVEIDHTIIDVIVVDPDDGMPLGRPTITTIVDRATRMIVGMHISFEPPSYHSVAQCIMHMVLPKNAKEKYGTVNEWPAYGLPHTLIVDNGKEFLGKDLDTVCKYFGITLHRTPVRTPSYKGAVERLYRGINTGVIHTLPGTTFSNPTQRGNYDSSKMAAITLAELEKILTIWIVDDYNEQMHTGINAIPARKWEEYTASGFYPRMPSSVDELEIVLGRNEQRIIHHYGIDLFNLRYNADELGLLRDRIERDRKTNTDKSRKVKVKYDPANLGHIWVYDEYNRRYIQAHIVERWRDYATNLSYWKHMFVQKVARENAGKVNFASIRRAIDLIAKIIAAANKRGKRMRGEARYKGTDTPQISPPDDTPSDDPYGYLDSDN